MMSTSIPGPTTSYGGARQGLTPFEPSKKRKERDGLEGAPRRPPITTKAELVSERKPMPSPSQTKPSDNRLLAGYLAHEFLTRGTLFGKPFDPTPALAAQKPEKEPPAPSVPKAAAYADVARLLKGENGAHIPGIVNPTQLGRWIQMQQ